MSVSDDQRHVSLSLRRFAPLLKLEQPGNRQPSLSWSRMALPRSREPEFGLLTKGKRPTRKCRIFEIEPHCLFPFGVKKADEPQESPDPLRRGALHPDRGLKRKRLD